MMQSLFLFVVMRVVSGFIPPESLRAYKRVVVGKEKVRLSVSSKENDVAEQLRKQAAQLREEAELLEKNMANERAAAIEKELSDFFREADANNDGVVSLEELREALRLKLVEENSNPRSADRIKQVLESEERVEAILKDLDTNADGVLQRDEIISISGFRERIEASIREGRQASLAVTSSAAVQAATEERLAILDAVSNSTNTSFRLTAAFCYLLPFLDAIPVDILTQLPPNPLSVSAVSAAIAFKTFPASGLIVFLALSFLASNAGIPRLTRFAARHAIILDLLAAFIIQLAYRFVPPPYNLATAIVFECALLLCVIAALLGKDADFIPGSGYLAKRFTDEFDDALRNIITTSSAAEFGLFIANADTNAKNLTSSMDTNTTSTSSSDTSSQTSLDQPDSAETKNDS